MIMTQKEQAQERAVKVLCAMIDRLRKDGGLPLNVQERLRDCAEMLTAIAFHGLMPHDQQSSYKLLDDLSKAMGMGSLPPWVDEREPATAERNAPSGECES